MNHLQWKPSDEEKLEMSSEGQHELYERPDHGYDREKGFLAGEGSEREMGYISSEPSLQEFIPHLMDQDNTPPPTGNYVVIIIIVIIIITQVMRATEVLTTWQWRGCHRWRWCPCMSNTPGWRRRNPRGSSRSKVCGEGWSPQLSDCCLPTELVTVSVGVSAWAKYQVIPNTNSYLYHSLSLELLERRLLYSYLKLTLVVKMYNFWPWICTWLLQKKICYQFESNDEIFNLIGLCILTTDLHFFLIDVSPTSLGRVIWVTWLSPPLAGHVRLVRLVRHVGRETSFRN